MYERLYEQYSREVGVHILETVSLVSIVKKFLIMKHISHLDLERIERENVFHIFGFPRS